ncbi:hypothetical protein VTL71DRAFT_168 [Oculimacula yallundae]|uniref:RNI-like protein n=1 Tax=Oculimacula yallundae TaxID=86028 RepID=A0ABR4CZG7_9HELO
MAEIITTICPVSPPPLNTSDFDSNTSTSLYADIAIEAEDFPILTYSSFTGPESLAVLQAIRNGDLTNEKIIKALPRRRNKSQRPFAQQLVKSLFPDVSELTAIIKYERLALPAQQYARQRERDRMALELQPKNNTGGQLIRIQGPWAGQEADPDFEPIFAFLEQDIPFMEVVGAPNPVFKSFDHKKEFTCTQGVELLWKRPLVEFGRGIVYDDGRLDLCKKVVGPTHIGQLMNSLEPNTQIKHFLLGNNAISSTGAKSTAEFISRHPNRMETWYLAGCHITRTGLQMLASQMISSTSITNLWFKRNPFGPGSSTVLAEVVLLVKNIRTLDLETTLSKFLASTECDLESLFLSTNPIGDTGIALLAPGLTINKTLKRLTLASTSLTSSGVSLLATALSSSTHPLHTLDLGASQTTKAHKQKFNYLDDTCIPYLAPLILSPSLRCLNLGRTVFSPSGIQEMRSFAAQSELLQFAVNNVQVTNLATGEGTSVPKSCSLETRNRLASNQKKYFPTFENYDAFLKSEELRFLKNRPDVSFIDSMYRTQDKRLGLPMDEQWKEGDKAWKLIIDDAEMWEKRLAGT